METTRDAFLGGRLTVLQPRSGYRAGIDPVLLAAAVPARPGESVLELGLGTGVASLCLGARVPALQLTGVELQAEYAGLTRQNAAMNGIAIEVVEADLSRLPGALTARSFDHVIANPPFHSARARRPSADPGRETAMGEHVPLGDWLRTGLRRLRPGGRLTLIHLAARLPTILAVLPETGVIIVPIAPRSGRDAERVIVACVKGSRAATRLAPQLILHEGPRHSADGDDFAPWATQVLRHGAALPGIA